MPGEKGQTLNKSNSNNKNSLQSRAVNLCLKGQRILDTLVRMETTNRNPHSGLPMIDLSNNT